MPTLLLSLTILVSHASALAFQGPRTTSQVEAKDLVFPPEPTAAPEVHPDLFKRQNVMTDLIAPDNTCGFISGLAGAAYYCNPDTDICAFFPGTSTTYGFIGCCNPTNFNCGARVTCINSQQYSSLCDNGCEKDTYTLKCTAATAPYCNGIRFPVEGVQDYFCDDTLVATWQTAYTTYSFENDGRVFSPLTVTLTSGIATTGTTGIPLTFQSSSSPASSAGASNPASTAGSESQSSAGPSVSSVPQTSSNSGPPLSSTAMPGGQSSTPTPTPLPSPSGGSSGPPIGAIVGGVVGGVAVLAIIALAAFCILRQKKKKHNDVAAANVNNGAPPPTYMPPQDPNSAAYAAANAGKPEPTAQETAMAGHWSPAQNQYPAQMQEQKYEPQANNQQYQPQQYSPQMQQHQYPNMAEVQGSYGQPQNSNSTYSAQNQTPNQHYSMISNATSPNPQSRLSAGYPDRGDATSPVSTHQPSELGTPGGQNAPHSPSPTFASASGVQAPAQTHEAPTVEGRAEMSANMAGASPTNAYEVPGSEVYHY